VVLAHAPVLSISCPVVAWLDSASVLVEFDWETTIADEELVAATIDYADGTSYQSTTMADVKRNMFWHHYRDEGRYAVAITFEHLDGTATAGCSLGVEVPTRVTTSTTSISSSVPVTEAGACDPNYEGACVPVADDIDCAGGSGNGPAYVRGPVSVVGTDIYGLDSDGDGVGCE
jgi:hypothetical protein